ncbi:DUF2461 domain-containing protein [Bacteroidales bacterium OttesenSCG-928-I14]|nr:DUF2461 domain-containing protein [Bacteroidales bacterium OttesenSCG-928-I14]
MKEIPFSGFDQQTFQFFADLMANNNKPWFEEHKHVYQECILQPLKAFAVAMTPVMHQIDPEMDFRPQKMISRIYRDIRFSHDKTPYKKHMWVSFQRPFNKMDVAWESFPGFYMEIGAEGVNLGMGMWMAKKKIMDRLRDQIEYEQDHFKEITKDLIGKHGFVLGGEEYKRPIKNDLPNYYQQWIQRKGIYLYKNILVNEKFYSPDFIKLMEKEYRLLQPLYDFFVDVCD